MPDSQPSLVQQAIWARTHRDEPRDDEYAVWHLGVEMRPCLFDCNRTTDRPDQICAAHDFDFGSPRWRDGSNVLDFRVTGRQEEIAAQVDAWYRERGYGT